MAKNKMKQILVTTAITTLCSVAGCIMPDHIPKGRVDYDARMTGRDRKLMQERNDRFPIHGGVRVDIDHSGSISSKERSDYEARWQREQERKRKPYSPDLPKE